MEDDVKNSFSEASQRKEMVKFEETEIHFMNYFDLIEDKKAMARKKDLEDIEQLKKLEEKIEATFEYIVEDTNNQTK